MENQLLIKRITHYGWYVFFALFAFVCIYSKLRDIHYLSDEMYLVIPYIIFSFLFTDLLSDEKITVKLFFLISIFAGVCGVALEFIRCWIVEGLIAFQLVWGLLVVDDVDTIDLALYDIFSMNYVIILGAVLVGVILYVIISKIIKKIS